MRLGKLMKSARSSSNVWAVGPPELGGPFVQRWDGNGWKSIPYPRGASSILAQVDATASTGYTWFAGFTEGQSGRTAFVDRYAGHWRDMRVLQVGSYGTALSGVAPVPRSADVWVVGEYDDSPSTSGNLAERYTCT